MLFNKALSLVAAAGMAAASPCDAHSTSTIEWETAYTATGSAAVAAAAATALTSSPTSHKKGKAFDRIVIVWFENTDYDKAYWDPNFTFFRKKGITLSNYFGVTHPSEPNYIAAVAGDYFGMDNDNFNRADKNVSNVVDLLEDAGISWGTYQEDMPFSGYEGFQYLNQQSGANDYVRKHNPPVLMDSNTQSQQRLSQMKNLSFVDPSRSMFHKDLAAGTLPQWVFITPNMTSDAHDSDVTVAGAWLKNFLQPLLHDKNFMKDTLVLLTFDENETYTIPNNVLSILIGDVIPADLVGTTDDHYYNHYSQIATVEANWNLGSLGRWDTGANVFKMVADKTGDKVRMWSSEETFNAHFYNESYAGVFQTGHGNSMYPAPNLALDNPKSGRPIAKIVKDTWKDSDAPTYYKDTIMNNDGLNPPKGYAAKN